MISIRKSRLVMDFPVSFNIENYLLESNDRSDQPASYAPFEGSSASPNQLMIQNINEGENQVRSNRLAPSTLYEGDDSYPSWAAINDSKDPLTLFKLVKKVHLTSLSTGKIKVNDKTTARNQFNALRQSQHVKDEPLPVFRKRFT